MRCNTTYTSPTLHQYELNGQLIAEFKPLIKENLTKKQQFSEFSPIFVPGNQENCAS